MEIKYQTDFTKQFLKMVVPDEWIDIFDISEIRGKEKEWNITLTEKKNLVPKEIGSKPCVLNGYCKPIELMGFPAKGKPVYIKIIRRKWKEAGYRGGYSNTYDLHYPGVKATKELADFLKGLNREELNEFLSAWPVYRNLRKKDTSLVQGFLKRFQ